MSTVTMPAFKSLADGLPPKLAAHVHPDWRKNEAAYWANREAILAEFSGFWVAYANGVVITSGLDPVDVLHDAVEIDKHPFFVRVGHECEPTRIRRRHDYDLNYRPASLPVIEVEYRESRGQAGVVLDRVIPDTGADASVIPWDECSLIGLDAELGFPDTVMGVGGSIAQTMAYVCWVFLYVKNTVFGYKLILKVTNA